MYRCLGGMEVLEQVKEGERLEEEGWEEREKGTEGGGGAGGAYMSM